MSLDKIVKVVLYKRHSHEKSGIVKLQIYDRISKKQTYHTTKIRVEEKYWDKKAQRVKKGNHNYIEINNKIQKVFDAFHQNNEKSFVLSLSDATFKSFYKEFILGYSAHGTIKKFNTLKNHIEAYLDSQNNSKDVKMNDITPYFIKGFNKYLKDKGLASSTRNRLLKNFKRIINKARQHRVYNQVLDPFIDIDFKFTSKQPIYLDENEIRRIVNIEEDKLDDNLKLIRLMSLFAIFAQGCRVGDTLLLQYKHIMPDSVLRFLMYKTRLPIEIQINNMVKEQLYEAVLRKHFDEGEYEEYGIALENYIQSKKLLFVERKKAKIDHEDRSVLFASLQNNLDRDFNTLFKEVNKICSDDFVFPLLRKEDFKNYNREHLTKHQFNQVMSKTALYNKRLKKLADICEIEKNITTHTMRHTYANQVLTPSNANLYEISKSLGHSSLKHTESYLRKFDAGKVKSMTDDLSGKYE